MGAPRCGTTSLAKYLKENSQICFSKPKEPHYFARLEEDLPVDVMREAYLRGYFPHIEPHHRVIGEGSVSYLYSPKALGRALAFDPGARFIAMVRNPVEMIYSYHARVLYTLDESERNLARAWGLQAARREGKSIPKRCRDPQLLQYAEIGSLGKHVETLFETVGRENCLVLVFDDFMADPLSAYKQVLSFIGVDYDGRTGFKRKNENQTFRYRWLQQYVMNPPPFVARFIAKREKKGLDRLSFLRKVRRKVEDVNRVRARRSTLDPAMRKVLVDAFKDDVDRLSSLLQRDFSHWT